MQAASTRFKTGSNRFIRVQTGSMQATPTRFKTGSNQVIWVQFGFSTKPEVVATFVDLSGGIQKKKKKSLPSSQT
jgi:hypothetical protein